jgi:uncharacterized Zn-binding protein involved in type VI secretion
VKGFIQMVSTISLSTSNSFLPKTPQKTSQYGGIVVRPNKRIQRLIQNSAPNTVQDSPVKQQRAEEKRQRKKDAQLMTAAEQKARKLGWLFTSSQPTDYHNRQDATHHYSQVILNQLPPLKRPGHTAELNMTPPSVSGHLRSLQNAIATMPSGTGVIITRKDTTTVNGIPVPRCGHTLKIENTELLDRTGEKVLAVATNFSDIEAKTYPAPDGTMMVNNNPTRLEQQFRLHTKLLPGGQEREHVVRATNMFLNPGTISNELDQFLNQFRKLGANPQNPTVRVKLPNGETIVAKKPEDLAKFPKYPLTQALQQIFG